MNKQFMILVSLPIMMALIAIMGLMNVLDVSANTALAPEITSVEVDASGVIIYDPDGSSNLVRTVFFNNSSAGHITTTITFNGTPTLELTASAAFDQPETTFTFDMGTPPFSQEISYTVTTGGSSQPKVTYAVAENAAQTDTAIITYRRDIEAPTTNVTTNLSDVITDPILMLQGTVADARSGVFTVEVNIDGQPLTVILDTVSPPVLNSDWSADWDVPTTDRMDVDLTYQATDNVNNTETLQMDTITIDNVAQVPQPVMVTYENNLLTAQWSNSVSDIVSYDVEIRDSQSLIVLAESTLTTSVTTAVSCGQAYQVRVRAHDEVGNVSNWSMPVNSAVVPCSIYLPLMRIPFFSGGEMQLSSSRFAGITSFIPEVTANFSQIQFVSPPTDMRLWLEGDTEPTTWVPYQVTGYAVALDENQIGEQTVRARFRAGQSTSSVKTAVVFYIPNGDFATNDLSDWMISGGLPTAVTNGVLRLGDPNSACASSPPGLAAAAFDLDIPANSNYQLHIEAVITTYDQLPDPTVGVYDAFEVFIDGNLIERYGNPHPPLSCANLRTVSVQEAYALQSYTGETEIRFENHRRFDNFYNTYTDINRVYVDK
jgi:hypothetical protein